MRCGEDEGFAPLQAFRQILCARGEDELPRRGLPGKVADPRQVRHFRHDSAQGCPAATLEPCQLLLVHLGKSDTKVVADVPALPKPWANSTYEGGPEARSDGRRQQRRDQESKQAHGQQVDMESLRHLFQRSMPRALFHQA